MKQLGDQPIIEPKALRSGLKKVISYFVLTNFVSTNYIYKLLTKNKKKSPKQQPTEIEVAGKDTMVITGIEMNYLSLKENAYGHNHFFNVLDITPLQQLIELRESLKMPIWDYNDKFYLKIND